MTCSTARELIHPYLDDELDANRRVEIEEHLEACPACAAVHAELQQLSNDIRTIAPRYTAPAGLQDRVLKDLHKSDLRGSSKAESYRPAQMWKGMAIAASVLLAVSLAWDLKLTRSTGDRDVIARELVSSHVRSLIGTHLLDVPSSDQHTVKPWFNGKLDFSPDVKDLTTDGFPLIGGRIEYFNNKPAAALVYKRRAHILNVFTWPALSSSPSQASRSENGYNVIGWTKAGMTYWTVSDLNKNELEEFVRLYQK